MQPRKPRLNSTISQLTKKQKIISSSSPAQHYSVPEKIVQAKKSIAVVVSCGLPIADCTILATCCCCWLAAVCCVFTVYLLKIHPSIISPHPVECWGKGIKIAVLLCSRILGYIMRRFLRSAMIVFSWFVVPYSRYTNIKVIRRKLPPIRSHLLEIPAVDLAKLIRTRKVSTSIQ